MGSTADYKGISWPFFDAATLLWALIVLPRRLPFSGHETLCHSTPSFRPRFAQTNGSCA